MRLKKVLSIINIFVLLLTLGGECFGQGTISLTLEQAIDITHKNNPVLKEMRYLQQEKEMEKKAALGLRLPRISLSANYMLLSDDLELDLNPVKDAITPLYEALGNYGSFSGVPNPDPTTSGAMPILPDNISTQVVRQKLLGGLEDINNANWVKTIQEKQFGTVSANVLWPIFTGGKITAANKAAEIAIDESKHVSKQKSDEILSELIERYYGLHLSGKVVDIRQDVFDVMETHLHDAKRMYEEGIIAKSQFLHAKLYHAEALRNLKKAQRNYCIVENALQNTLSSKTGDSIIPMSKLFYLKKIEPVEYFSKKASQFNPLLNQVRSKEQLAHQGVKIKNSNYYPTAAIAGMYDLYNKDFSPYAPEWAVGLNLRWTLFDGIARTRKIQAAKFKEKQVTEIKNKAEDNINTVINKLYQTLNMNVEQMEQLGAAKEYANEYFVVSQKSFREGMSTSTEVTDASLALAKVRIEKLEVMYYYVTTLSKLLEFSGNSEAFISYQHRDNTIFETEK
ncbi:MAG: TolC family protein [Bacteroidota bacterium]|nr:TolC family protein [Bacteroidota bacterium]